MEEFMAQLQEQLRLAECGLSDLNSKIKKTKCEMQIKDRNIFESQDKFAVVLKAQPKHSFTKQKRFANSSINFYKQPSSPIKHKSDEKQTPQKNSKNMQQQNVKQPKSIIFSKASRFDNISYKTQIMDQSKLQELNPNYEISRKRAPNAIIINSPEKKHGAKNKLKQAIQSSPQQFDGEESICSVTTAATLDHLGPGAYNVQYNAVERNYRTGGISYNLSHIKRQFQVEQKKEEYTPLKINYDVVRKSVTNITGMMKPTPKNRQQLQKQAIDDLHERKKAFLYQSLPLEFDRIKKLNVCSAVYRQQHAEKIKRDVPKSRLLRLFQMLELLRINRVGPSKYKPFSTHKAICQVAYRKSHSPKIKRRYQIKHPAPNQYYAKDDMIREHQPNFKFGKQARIKKVRREDLDMRADLDVKLDLVKSRSVQAIILQKKNKSILPDFEALNKAKLGPAAYTPLFTQTETRDDKGVLSFPALTSFNSRKHVLEQMYKKAENVDTDINPNFDFDKPNRLVFKYYEPYIVKPQHMPDKLLFREKWKFYDINLDNYKEIMAQPGFCDFSRNKTFNEFQEHEQELKNLLMAKFLSKKLMIPEVGQYDVQYTQLDKNVPQLDFAKQLERRVSIEVDPDKEELILNPEKPSAKVIAHDFGKLKGREEAMSKEEIENQVTLDLDVKYDLVEAKAVALVNMKKNEGRKGINDPWEEIRENAPTKLDLDVNYNLVEARITNVDFGKLVSRENDIMNNPYPKDGAEDQSQLYLDLNYDQLKKSTDKTAVRMTKGERRFFDPMKLGTNNQDNGIDGEDIQSLAMQTEQQIDYTKSYDQVKEGSGGSMRFEGYSGRDIQKIDATQVIENKAKLELNVIEEVVEEQQIEKITRKDQKNQAIPQKQKSQNSQLNDKANNIKEDQKKQKQKITANQNQNKISATKISKNSSKIQINQNSKEQIKTKIIKNQNDISPWSDQQQGQSVDEN